MAMAEDIERVPKPLEGMPQTVGGERTQPSTLEKAAAQDQRLVWLAVARQLSWLRRIVVEVRQHVRPPAVRFHQMINSYVARISLSYSGTPTKIGANNLLMHAGAPQRFGLDVFDQADQR